MSRPSRLLRCALLLLLLAGSGAGVAFRQAARQKTADKQKAVQAAPTAGWKEVDRLASEQKFEEAAKRVEEILTAARGRRDEAEWARALVRKTQLTIGLHGYETAVRFLKEQPWPEGPLPRATLDLFYAQALTTYARAYSWEIARRERVESRGAVDLAAWTREQIFAEAQRAYLEVWRKRAALGQFGVATLAEYLEPNTYPARVRGTLRDVVTYLFVELLADTSGWTPQQSNEIFRLDLEKLLHKEGPASDALLTNAAAHPLEKIVAVLSDLESWHAGAGGREAALEARLERVRRL
ncbi:MAG TPA: hypothetical protein VER78_01275, partial [Thermoanaerobaculia bacterium]|nr:hypothetical protein [Thermoanaerobaculia bacterium]